MNHSSQSLMHGCGGEVTGDIPRVETLVYITFLFSQLFISAFGNTLVCVAILRFRHLKTLTNTFIFSLAITDILTPLVRILYIAIAILKNRWVFGCFWCKMSSMLGVFLCAASILHLCAISLERFVVIRWPLRHTQLITKRRVIMAVIGIWITSLLLSLFPYFDFVEMSFNKHLLDCEIDWQHKPYLTVLLLIFFFLAPFLIMTGTYYFIFKEVHKQTRRISNITGSRRRNDSKISRFRKNSTIRQELKAVKTVIVVIGVFFVLWLPFFIATTVRAYFPTSVPPSWQRAVLGLAYLNSSCNWVIYSVMNRQIREAFRKLIFSCNHGASDSLKFESTTGRKFSQTGAVVMQYFQRNSGIKHKNLKRKQEIMSPAVISNRQPNISESVEDTEKNYLSQTSTRTTLASPTQVNYDDEHKLPENGQDINISPVKEQEDQLNSSQLLDSTADNNEQCDDTGECIANGHIITHDNENSNNKIECIGKENSSTEINKNCVGEQSGQEMDNGQLLPGKNTPNIINNPKDINDNSKDFRYLPSQINSALGHTIQDNIVL